MINNYYECSMEMNHAGFTNLISFISPMVFYTGSSNGATRCLGVDIMEDFALEGTQNFTVTLKSTDSDVIVRTAVTTVEIIDNDGKCNHCSDLNL